MSSNADEPVFVDPRREHQRIAERLVEFGTVSCKETSPIDEHLIETFGPTVPGDAPSCYGEFDIIGQRERGCHQCAFFDQCRKWTVVKRPPEDPKESDPNGIPQHAPGAKLDAGKTRLWLVFSGFANALEEVGKVGTFGAKKHCDDGWKSVPDGYARYSSAMLRHIMKEARGEAIDPDFGLLHAAHTAWNALARLELLLAERGDLE